MADEGNGTGSNVIWALATIIIVAIIAAVVMYSGLLNGGGTKKNEVDVKVSVPGGPSR